MMKKKVLVAVAVVLATCFCTDSSAAEEGTSGKKEDANRFVIHDGKLVVHRPDATWKFQADASEPPVIAVMTSRDAAADVSIQAQVVPGMLLQDLKQMVEDALKAQVDDFIKHEGADREINGLQAYELHCTLTKDGTVKKVKMVVFKPDASLYIVKCLASPKNWDRFQKQFEEVVASFRVVDTLGQGSKDASPGA